MTDVTLNAARLTRSHRNLAAFGDPHRPYRGRHMPALLYSDLLRCAGTITSREAYVEATLVGLRYRGDDTLDAASWMRVTVQGTASDRVLMGDDAALPDRPLDDDQLENVEGIVAEQLELALNNP